MISFQFRFSSFQLMHRSRELFNFIILFISCSETEWNVVVYNDKSASILYEFPSSSSSLRRSPSRRNDFLETKWEMKNAHNRHNEFPWTTETKQRRLDSRLVFILWHKMKRNIRLFVLKPGKRKEIRACGIFQITKASTTIEPTRVCLESSFGEGQGLR